MVSELNDDILCTPSAFTSFSGRYRSHDVDN